MSKGTSHIWSGSSGFGHRGDTWESWDFPRDVTGPASSNAGIQNAPRSVGCSRNMSIDILSYIGYE